MPHRHDSLPPLNRNSSKLDSATGYGGSVGRSGKPKLIPGVQPKPGFPATQCWEDKGTESPEIEMAQYGVTCAKLTGKSSST